VLLYYLWLLSSSICYFPEGRMYQHHGSANQSLVCPESCRLLAGCVNWPGVAAGVGGNGWPAAGGCAMAVESIIGVRRRF